MPPNPAKNRNTHSAVKVPRPIFRFMKNWLFLALIFVALLDASAQRRNYRAGSAKSDEGQGEWFHTLGYDYGIGIDLTNGYLPFQSNGITWAPRYTVPIGSEMSVGAMAPVGLGFSKMPMEGFRWPTTIPWQQPSRWGWAAPAKPTCPLGPL